MPASEFNRFDRAGDYLQGPALGLTLARLDAGVNVSGPPNAIGNVIGWQDAPGSGGVLKAGLRRFDDDLEFYDRTHLAWIKLSTLTGAGLVGYAVFQEFIATAGQTLFIFTPPGVYPVGVNALEVYVDGVRLDHSQFTETAADRFTLGPSVPPLLAGQHVTGFVPRGIPAPGSVFSVMVSGGDTTPSYLESKIQQGTNVTITKMLAGANEYLLVAAADSKVKISGTDTTEGSLETKLVQGTNITLTKQNAGFNENILVSSTDAKVKVNGADTTEGDLDTKITVSNGVAKNVTGVPGDGRLNLSASAAALYTPSTPADWQGAAPTTVQQALDRLAAAIALHLGAGIP